ncbi:UDP-N-acetylglucosamine 2-epimerase (non-hydrolyzing) [Shimazuella sp. AN120528]|uniref:non-hydrolyzing UDP-N-acetylglucosamine 2-epimerase n=1 Tax=Shimazuella soli TaxID=1892854 RepID=UPI001F0F5A78|nr:UDP-N-acetylglucosamine 2-epimerase (non-hydrolyzing) [Shimazuella soli]MCH5586683.1 UDP-N-acetylglucosamine 2-epimerase (non-hydrolyzing) [Shimazuella soli]
MLRILVVFGTRPEAIKMSPLIYELQQHPDLETFLCVTSQHRQMLKQVLKAFHLKPNFDLEVMTDHQTLTEITYRVLVGMETVLNQLKPDLVLVHGDTTTTFSVSLAAAYQQIKVGHVEAGMRTHQKYLPYPEELNRRLVGSLADLHFAPTDKEANHLYREGISKDSVYITGNTAIDALSMTIQENYDHPLIKQVQGKKMILITAHRRENLGEPMDNMFQAIRRLVETYSDVVAVFPIHLNPIIQKKANSILRHHPRILLVDPLDVMDFHNIAARSYLILTDSGGIQEEAPSLHAPVLVMRDVTERPEVVRVGAAKLVGTDENRIFEEASILIKDRKAYQSMTGINNPYGDGKASKRIVQGILHHYRLTDYPPTPFR